jgi:hypothetical protein
VVIDSSLRGPPPGEGAGFRCPSCDAEYPELTPPQAGEDPHVCDYCQPAVELVPRSKSES